MVVLVLQDKEKMVVMGLLEMAVVAVVVHYKMEITQVVMMVAMVEMDLLTYFAQAQMKHEQAAAVVVQEKLKLD
jgi:hypothetical protein